MAAAGAGAEPGAAVVSRIERPGPSAQSGPGEAALVPTAAVVPTSTLCVTGAAVRVAPNILSGTHWERFLAASSTCRFHVSTGPPSCAAPSTWTSSSAPVRSHGPLPWATLGALHDEGRVEECRGGAADLFAVADVGGTARSAREAPSCVAQAASVC